MDEQASFEPQAVLAPRRAGWNRLAVIVPAFALALTAWAGLSGPRSDSDQTAIATPVLSPATGLVATPRLPAALVRPGWPTQVVGIDVQRLDDVRRERLGRDDVTAIAGWYVATAITDCPPLAAIYRPAALPEIRGDADSWAFCDRSGVLYASRPDLEQGLPTNNLEDNRSKGAGLPAVPVILVIGVVVPPELEVIGAEATPVVVVGRFVDSNTGCGSPAVCRRDLVVDHVAWADGIDDEQLVGSSSEVSGQRPRVPPDGVNLLTGG